MTPLEPAPRQRPPARRARFLAIALAAGLGAVLVLAGEARGAKYEVVQCGWHVGADADWADTTGGAKFRQDSYCAAPAAVDPFDGVHLKSFTRDGQQTVSGTRFARWHWTAPPGTGITQVRGTWWQTLHDGMEQRLGTVTAGGFDVFARAAATDTSPSEFVAGFPQPRAAFEDRLLCAKPEDRWCGLEPGSWSALRALTLTLEDDLAPGAAAAGELLAGGWRRGPQAFQVGGTDAGGGLRYAEAYLDGARVAQVGFPCAAILVGGEWRATAMRPCQPSAVSAAQAVATTAFSDGPHRFLACVADFAGNANCTAAQTVLVDNNPPAHPRAPLVAGGEGWHRTNDFTVSWEDPDQGVASPIAGASWRIAGPAGYDTGARFAAGLGLARIEHLALPHAGSYALQLWLRDEAGNESPATAVTVPLRLDDVAPGVAFEPGADGAPGTVRAEVADEHSGPAAGRIRYRRLGTSAWTDLPTYLTAGQSPGTAELAATLPQSLPPGTYALQAEAADGAGNVATTTRRADGTQMAVRVEAPATARASGPRARTRLFARLSWHGRRGTGVTVPFAAEAWLSGRLLDADGAGLARRGIRVVLRPSRGALAATRRLSVRTGAHGGFRLRLPAGTSRRVVVAFPGDERLEPARRGPLSMRVRAGVVLHARSLSLRTGETLRLLGRVRARGASIPRRGKLVAIQYLEEATGRWRPVVVVRSDHSGRFRARYRFRYLSGRARIRIRAVALAEERWPYAPGASRALLVSVNG